MYKNIDKKKILALKDLVEYQEGDEEEDEEDEE